MVIAAVLYLLLAWLVFVRLKLLRWNWFTGAATIILGLIVVAAFAAFLTALAPAGRISVAGRVVEVTPNVSGQVTQIPVRTNELMPAGTILFQIDPTPFAYKVKELEARLVEAQQSAKQLQTTADAASADVKAVSAQLDFAQQRRDDLEKLVKSNGASQFNLQDMQRQVDTLNAQLASSAARETGARLALDSQIQGVNTNVAQLDAQLGQARWELEQTIVRAPSDGYVTLLALTVGDRTSNLKSALSFIVLKDIQIIGIFPQAGLQTIKPGAAVQFALADRPLRMFRSTIGDIVRGVGEGQVAASGTLARVTALPMTTEYPVAIVMPWNLDPTKLRLGTAGTATVFAPHSAPFDFFGTLLLWTRAAAMYL
jgi:multidrug resistance efflux pump